MAETFSPQSFDNPEKSRRNTDRRKMRRASVYLGPCTERVLRDTGEGSSFSFRLEETVRRFHAVFRHLLPKDMSADEWAVLAMGLQYVDGDEEDRAWSTLLGWGFRYGTQVEEQYGLDVEMMARQLRDRGPAVNIVIAEAIHSYWDMAPDWSHAQRLEYLGVIHPGKGVA